MGKRSPAARERPCIFGRSTSSSAKLEGGHQSPVTLLCWLDEGKTLISGSESETCFWDRGASKPRQTLEGDCGEVLPQARLLVSRGGSMIRLRSLDDGRPLYTTVSLREEPYAILGPEGDYSFVPGVEKEFVYVVQTEEGQETISVAEFSKRFGWKNDPAKARLEKEAVDRATRQPSP